VSYGNKYLNSFQKFITLHKYGLVRALCERGMARLENYTMFAKDRSFVGSLVAVKGKDNC
jgi:hypothetical protein